MMMMPRQSPIISTRITAAECSTFSNGRDIGAVHKVLTRTTWIGRHRFNTKFWKTRERKPDTEVVSSCPKSRQWTSIRSSPT